MHGNFRENIHPIFNDPVKGEEARKLFDDAQKYLGEITEKNLITAKAVFGIFPAVSTGDDIIAYSGNEDERKSFTFRFLRNQETKEKGVHNLALSDYIAPGRRA